jgi:hypothetical protein
MVSHSVDSLQVGDVVLLEDHTSSLECENGGLDVRGVPGHLGVQASAGRL